MPPNSKYLYLMQVLFLDIQRLTDVWILIIKIFVTVDFSNFLHKLVTRYIV